jgi:hypothetical protein
MARSSPKRPPTSETTKERLRQAQLNYIRHDPRWAAHRARLSEAQKKPDQRATLSAKQLAYMANDPRWPEHESRFRQAAIEVTRLTLLPEEIDLVIQLRAKGRTFEYLGEELCVSDRIIRRELKALGVPIGRVPGRPKAKRGQGPWRSFDP